MKAILLASALLFSSAALADSTGTEGSKFHPSQFAQHRANIVEELQRGDLYREISEENREAVIDALDRMAEVLDGVSSVDALPDDEKIALFNDQELVNTLLTEARNDSRLICTREHTVGTRFKRVDCATVLQRRERTRDSQNALRTLQQPKYTDFGGV